MKAKQLLGQLLEIDLVWLSNEMKCEMLFYSFSLAKVLLMWTTMQQLATVQIDDEW